VIKFAVVHNSRSSFRLHDYGRARLVRWATKAPPAFADAKSLERHRFCGVLSSGKDY